MSARGAARLAWGIWAGSVLLLAIGLVLLAQSGHRPPGADTDHGGSPVFDLVFLAFSTVGAVIASRRPTNPIGWLLLATGVTANLGLNGFGYGYVNYSLARPGGPLPAFASVAWLTALLNTASIYVALFVFLIFPTGRLPARGWERVVCWLAAGLGVLATATVSLRPGPIENFPAIDNPLGLAGAAIDLATTVASVTTRMGPGVLLLSGAIMLTRLRRARGVERQQLKWVAYALTLVPVYYAGMVIVSSLWPEVARQNPALYQLIGLGWDLTVAGLPVSIGIAILRYHLYEIDLIIRRTLAYAVLTGFLAALYFGGVVLLQQLIRGVTGQQSDLAIVGSTLAIAAVFQPLRQGIQRFIDRRFNRRAYDAAQVLATFGTTVRDEVDLTRLSEGLIAVVEETMQPAHVSLWLRGATAHRRVGEHPLTEARR